MAAAHDGRRPFHKPETVRRFGTKRVVMPPKLQSCFRQRPLLAAAPQKCSNREERESFAGITRRRPATPPCRRRPLGARTPSQRHRRRLGNPRPAEPFFSKGGIKTLFFPTSSAPQSPKDRSHVRCGGWLKAPPPLAIDRGRGGGTTRTSSGYSLIEDHVRPRSVSGIGILPHPNPLAAARSVRTVSASGAAFPISIRNPRSAHD